MTGGAGKTMTWFSYNLPNLITKGTSSSQFFYGAGRGRYKQIAVAGAGGSLPAGTETTVYVGGLFEKVTKPSGVDRVQALHLGRAAIRSRCARCAPMA